MAAPVFFFDAEQFIGITVIGDGEICDFGFIITLIHEAMIKNSNRTGK